MPSSHAPRRRRLRRAAQRRCRLPSAAPSPPIRRASSSLLPLLRHRSPFSSLATSPSYSPPVVLPRRPMRRRRMRRGRRCGGGPQEWEAPKGRRSGEGGGGGSVAAREADVAAERGGAEMGRGALRKKMVSCNSAILPKSSLPPCFCFLAPPSLRSSMPTNKAFDKMPYRHINTSELLKVCSSNAARRATNTFVDGPKKIKMVN